MIRFIMHEKYFYCISFEFIFLCKYYINSILFAYIRFQKLNDTNKLLVPKKI